MFGDSLCPRVMRSVFCVANGLNINEARTSWAIAIVAPVRCGVSIEGHGVFGLFGFRFHLRFVCSPPISATYFLILLLIVFEVARCTGSWFPHRHTPMARHLSTRSMCPSTVAVP